MGDWFHNWWEEIGNILRETTTIVFAHIAADILLSALWICITLAAVFGRRSLARTPLTVLFRRIGLVGKSTQPLIAAPGFLSPDLRVGDVIVGLPSSVQLVGLLDGLALCRLQEVLHRTFPREKFELVTHERVADVRRPLFSVGGSSVNQLTGSMMGYLLRRGVWMEYPAHVAHVLGKSFRFEGPPQGPQSDHGFLIMKKNEWDPTTGCCLLFGVYPAGTWAAAALLESPMRYRLLEQLLGKSTWYVWFRLIADRLGLHRFTDLECDWIVVVKCDLSVSGMLPGEPTVVLARKIPEIPNWDSSARAELWHRVASSPGWTGVAGDEPDLSTRMILEWLSQFSFSGESLLDFGCGPGRLFEAYFRHGPPDILVAMDIDQRMLERAQSHFNSIDRASDVHFEVRQGDAGDLRFFGKQKFTIVICWTVLNHILDDNECIETLRLLCNLAQNRIIVCDPICEELEQPVVSTGFPSKRRRLSFYVTVIRDEGFDVSASIQRFGSPGHPESHRATILGERPRGEEANPG